LYLQQTASLFCLPPGLIILATRGLTGLATGFATHQFITQRMEHIGAYHEALQHLVGEQEAIRIVAETLEAVQAAPGGMHEL